MQAMKKVREVRSQLLDVMKSQRIRLKSCGAPGRTLAILKGRGGQFLVMVEEKEEGIPCDIKREGGQFRDG